MGRWGPVLIGGYGVGIRGRSDTVAAATADRTFAPELDKLLRAVATNH